MAELIITDRARRIAADALLAENARKGREAHAGHAIGEILAGKRDDAPAVQIVAFTLAEVAK